MEGSRINEISVSHCCNFHLQQKFPEDTNWASKGMSMVFLSRSPATLAPVVRPGGSFGGTARKSKSKNRTGAKILLLLLAPQ